MREVHRSFAAPATIVISRQHPGYTDGSDPEHFCGKRQRASLSSWMNQYACQATRRQAVVVPLQQSRAMFSPRDIAGSAA
jgi:hypothetical protein